MRNLLSYCKIYKGKLNNYNKNMNVMKNNKRNHKLKKHYHNPLFVKANNQHKLKHHKKRKIRKKML